MHRATYLLLVTSLEWLRSVHLEYYRLSHIYPIVSMTRQMMITQFKLAISKFSFPKITLPCQSSAWTWMQYQFDRNGFLLEPLLTCPSLRGAWPSLGSPQIPQGQVLANTGPRYFAQIPVVLLVFSETCHGR